MDIMNTFWALVPALIAIIVALISREVYVSLFIGIVLGALLITNFNVLEAFPEIFRLFSEGVGFSIVNPEESSPYNFSILIFLVLLGILVVLLNKSGGAKAYGTWSSKTIKTRKGVMGATIGLGALISVDDYFNNLTVGSIMVPVTDDHKISRAKLAYLIDSIAAPICIICPLSSWAVAVSGVVSEQGLNGFSTFIRTIPFNLYALLTITMLVTLTVSGFDFGRMRKYENKALSGNDESMAADGSNDILLNLKISEKGRVFDLIIPIIVLIITSIFFMLYTGGLFSGEYTILEAFGECDSGLSLCAGALCAIVTCAIMYLPRKLMNYKEFTSAFVEGFRSMVPAILILVLAWTLNNVCQDLGIKIYVNEVISSSGISLNLVPAIFFLLALGLAFATGTSWGTFSILIPLAVTIVSSDSTLTIIAIAAILSGAVCGDHVSPISDTTILASTGSKCNHIIHVNTQMPYAFLVAGVCFINYIIAGFTKNVYLTLLLSIVMLIGAIFLLYYLTKRKEKKNVENENIQLEE